MCAISDSATAAMIPNSASISVESGTVTWENGDFQISMDEAKAIGDEISDLINRPNIENVLVDNRSAAGTWPTEVSEYWAELMADMYENDIDCATVSPSATNAMQINRLADKQGLADRIKAFKASEYDDALGFLGLDE